MIKQNKGTPSRILAIIGIVIIYCCFIFFGLKIILRLLESQIPSTFYIKVPVQQNQNGVNITPTEVLLKVTIAFTPKSQVYQSTSLVVSITTDEDYPSLLTPEADQTQLDSIVPDIDGLTAQFEAQLSASAFDIDSQKQGPISLSTEGEALFGWSITPKYVGPQTLLVSIVALDSQGAHTLEVSVIHVTVNATKAVALRNITSDPNAILNNFLNLSQVTLGGFLATLLGSALNIPWIIESYKKKKEKQKSQQSPPSQITGTSPTIANISQPPAKKKRKGTSQHKRL